MAYSLVHTSVARKEHESLPPEIKVRVERWYDLLIEEPRRTKSKQLTDRPDLRRVHVGRDWVIVYSIKESMKTVLVVRVAHRSAVYRRLPKGPLN